MILWAHHFIAIVIGLTLIIHWRLVVMFFLDVKQIIPILVNQGHIAAWNRLVSSLTTILVFWCLNISSLIGLYWDKRWEVYLLCAILFSTFLVSLTFPLYIFLILRLLSLGLLALIF